MVLISACSDSDPGVMAEIGPYTMQVRTTPHPLEVGRQAGIQVLLRHSENKPVTGCSVKFRQYMPGMGMSSDRTFYDMGEENSSGSYRGRGGKYSMGGDWVLEFVLQCDDQVYTQPISYHLEWPE